MSKSAAERQAAYRRKRPFAGKEGNGQRRLNTWLDTGPSLALARLARRNAVSQRVMLERLIVAADEAIFMKLGMDTPEWAEYFALGQDLND